jgi:SM-20-related protein
MTPVYIIAPLPGRTDLNHTPLAPTAPLPSIESLALSLEQQGFAVAPDGLPADVALALAVYAARVDTDTFHAAGIGRGMEQQRNREIRRDLVHWMDERNPVLAPWRDWTESLRIHLNRQLFLGLFSFESHLALYRPGDFYRTHVDAFRGEANRVVSLVCYLNEGWSDGDGGELVLYTELGAITVQPVYRTVALFLSEEVPHEVKPARRDRYSVTGWFRLNSTSLDRVDPPR